MISDNPSTHEKSKGDEKIVQMYHELKAYEYGHIDFLTLLDRWEGILGIKSRVEKDEVLNTELAL